ncbi:ISP domain-containing protein [Cucurbitaria berberidis CBS 394.84]|uniref:Choline monooxygenase, chloroplastic n=1 Tax=Cucurbitaria berberidis CBS 394.84 TaxID=1168544 RepID=A0A9P4G938_9PLEO|nr:ISP domain-containing protein [Cucurbitaria berberidis CBS 394.84]KAF1841290.1 ISP domain-containing protein [Cucurbitaria berberidis CBS 394.84]
MPSTVLEKSFGSTLPAAWYREQAFYDLERRAIFSNHWLLITHASRFRESGQYVRFEMANYPFFVIKDRQGKINAFLNVCRHRAFPLIHQDSGTARIIACKYHGWSYGINGKLAKAPRFDSLPDFDKSEFSLFKIHTHIDKMGFIYVNFDNSPEPIPWSSQFGGIDEQQRMNQFNLDDYVFDHDWKMDGNFNWKALVENYNECYHCSVAHPGFASFLKPEGDFPKAFKKNFIEYYVEGSMKADAVVIPAAPQFLFPNATMTISGAFFYMMSAVPTSPTTSIMSYQIFRNKTASDEDFNDACEFFKQVEREDKVLGNGVQINLNTDTYIAGPLHPRMEDAVIQFQSWLRSKLHEHRAQEQNGGGEIWPARRARQEDAQLEEDLPD